MATTVKKSKYTIDEDLLQAQLQVTSEHDNDFYYVDLQEGEAAVDDVIDIVED